ncbi:hypothetical protein EX30DRAFT_187504 [Ascodesmis nigricans]|uniref:NAD(P)-binding protein n=1 Tax=Ascodesmis nigricans TaxID=341454 RepID=A0A4S2N0E3_9PEZI|nr:hypothetical protein EX30DRAFT_187504 [Ascodesmis nigricans]
MSRNLATKATHPSAGLPVIVYNRTFARTEAFAGSLPDGAVTIAKTIEDAVEPADIIWTSLSNDQTVIDVYEEALKQDVKGKIFVETSTILPETADKVAEMVEKQGAEFVTCPVFGAPATADAGTVIAVLAGKPSTVSKISPYLDGTISRKTIAMPSESPSKALLLKLHGNSFILSMISALSYGHTFAEKTGLGTSVLHEFITSMFPGPYAAYSERMLSGDYYTRDEPLFAVDLARKDLGHMLTLADAVGVDMKVLRVVDEHLKIVKKEMGEKGDLPGVYGAVRLESGLPFGNQEKEEEQD